jgi:hypothetical protein
MPNTDTDAASGETAVRAYLNYLQDPDSLVDDDKIATLDKEVAAAQDPIDRLMAMAALHRARQADPSSLIDDFTKNARAWAAAEGVPESAFREMNVPDDVLRAAGFGKVRKGQAGKSAPSRQKRQRVSTADLRDGILAFDGPFTIRDVSERIGGSPLTVKQMIATLEEQGNLQPAGEKHGSRGRAAKTWTVSPA